MDACCGDGNTRTVYIVGQLTLPHNGRYSVHGVYTTEAAAVACADNEDCFVSEIALDTEIDGTKPLAAWYPMLEDRPTTFDESRTWPVEDVA